MRKLTLALALVIALSLIAGVACGGSSSPGPGATPTPSPPVSTPTASPTEPTATLMPSPTPTTVATATDTPYLTHTDEANGFAVDHPAEWTWSDELVTETENALAAFRSTTEEGSFQPYMTVTRTPTIMSLSVRTVFDYAHQQISGYRMATEFPGYVSVSDEDTTLAGLDAIEHAFTFNEGGLDLKAKRIWVVRELQAWVVHCVVTEASFDSWEPVLDDVLFSLKFL